MQKKLILKLKLYNEKNMILQTEQKKFQISDEGMKKFLISSLDLAGIDYREVDNLGETTDLENLHQLIKQGFTIRIDEIGDELRFTAYIDKASTGFIVSKEQGISRLLLNAEDWAETMLEDLNKSNNL